VTFDGVDLATLDRGELRRSRRRMQMIFQDPYSSLNPRMTAGGIIGEPLEIHGIGNGKERRTRVRDLLSTVGASAGRGSAALAGALCGGVGVEAVARPVAWSCSGDPST
jgi:ABC-type microcin C transport system duplicated ATPase subunit YejF